MSDDKMIVCPKCQTECEQNSEECIKCGLNFDKYNKRGDDLFKHAINFAKKKQFDSARKMLRKISSEYPKLAKQANEYTEQMDEIEKDCLFENAVEYFKNAKLDEAKTKFKEISSNHPDLADNANDYIEKIDQQKKENLFNSAKRYFSEGRLMDAEYRFKKISATYPDLAEEANKYIEEIKQKPKTSFRPIDFLRFFAWLDLLCGIVGAIWIWENIDSKDPIGVVLCFATLFQGMFLCSLFLVICSIAENLIEIRENTQKGFPS